MTTVDTLNWQIGDISVTSIVEVPKFAGPVDMMLEDATIAIGEPYYDWLKPHFVREDGEFLLQWQAFVIRTDDRVIMIDTCIGNDRKLHFEWFNNMQTSFLEDLIAAGVHPDQVDTVCCTHMHFDHVGWNTRLVDGEWVPTFPNARYLFDKTEYAEITHMKETGNFHADHLPETIDPIIAADLHEFIDADGYEICPGVRMERTPGHTAGHCSVYIESQGEHAVIIGDMMHHPIQCAIPDHYVPLDNDPATGIKTRVEFVKSNADKDIMVIGNHFCDPVAGWICSAGDSWKFVTEREQQGTESN